MKKRLFHDFQDYGDEQEDSPRKRRYEQRHNLRQRDEMHKIIQQQENRIEDLEICKSENLKKASNYETQSLEIYSRRREMRDGFAEVLAIKQEYDVLSGR